MTRRTLKKELGFAFDFGAKDAKLIGTDGIVVSEWVRKKCQFGCECYGHYLTCPPYSPPPEETARVVRCFSKAILFNHPDYSVVSDIAFRLERELFLSGFHKSFGMGAGPCHLCDRCNPKRGCVHPREARPSMEACGIDVFETARHNGFRIKTLKSPDEKPLYFGLVLIF
jgi:predicted metal-binding protein